MSASQTRSSSSAASRSAVTRWWTRTAGLRQSSGPSCGQPSAGPRTQAGAGGPRSSGPDTRAAAAFADSALRRVTEVIDRRRPLAQLRPLLAAGLVDSLLTGPARHRYCGAARLLRVVAQATSPDGTSAEIAANYSHWGTGCMRSHAAWSVS